MSKTEDRTLLRPDVAQASDGEGTLVRDGEATLVRSGTTETSVGAATPEAPGRYRVVREYGRGGMSRVMLAVDEHIGREIALKELLDQPAADGTPRNTQPAAARFVREARITAQLEHPNIVPVYEVGQHADGAFYYTQKLVRGVTLKARLREARDLAARLKLLSHFADLCHAVAYAHSRGVVHRDLKPENVMVGQFGETVLLDWGLAKARGEKDVKAREIAREAEALRSPDATLEGHALGTPSYMSPEQALGKLDEIDERSDVWSLGAILFEILTGRPPFQGETAYSVIGKVIAEPPPRVREVSMDAPRELAAVAERCLSRDRARRYGSAEEIASEVEAYQSGGNVRAYEYSSWELLTRFVQRHKALTTVSGLALLLLVIALLAIRDEAARAKAALATARRNLSAAFLEKAHAAERDFFWHRAELFYAAARMQDDTPEARWGAVIEGEDAAGVTRVSGHSGWVLGVAISPDGTTVASSGWDATARIFAVETGRELWRFQGRELIERVVFSPDGKRLGTRDTSGLIELHDVGTGALLGRVRCPESSGRGSLAFRGDTLVAACPSALLMLPEGAGQPGADRLAVCAGGTLLSRLGDRVQLGGRELRVPQPAALACTRFAAVAGAAGVALFDPKSGAPAGTLPAASGALALSADGRYLAAVTGERNVTLYDTAARRPLAMLARTTPVKDVAIAKDGSLLAVAEEDGAVVLWRPALSRERDAAEGFAFLAGGTRAVVRDEKLVLTDAGGNTLAALPGAGAVLHSALSADGALFATATASELTLWDLQGRRALRKLALDAPVALGFAGTRLVVARLGTATLEVMKPGTLEVEQTLSGGTHDDLVAASAEAIWFGVPEQMLLVRLSLPSGERTQVHAAPQALALSRDGTQLAYAEPSRVMLLDARTLAPRGELATAGSAALSLAFSPDSRLLAVAGLEAAAAVYDVNARAEVAHLPIEGGGLLRGLAFSPDGALLRIGVAGSLRSVFVRIGRPESLPSPAEQLDGVVRDHGVVLRETEFVPQRPPVWANEAGVCAATCPP